MHTDINAKARLLTGDTPTGPLHLGHWVGSLKTRVELQESHDCYFIIANTHAFTTHPERADSIHRNVLDVTLDYLAAGIDPQKSTIFIQSEIPAIAELTYFLSMLLPFSRVMRNPTVKEEINTKGLGDHYSFGFLLYPVGQVADILAFRPERVPVGADQLPHLEMTREVARRFNQIYCGVDPHASDEQATLLGGLFPIIRPEPIAAQRLVGIGPPNENGVLPKMSKSLNNAILLSDPPELIQQKVMGMYTDPKRIRATDPGTVENNPLWALHDAFHPDTQWVAQAKERYRAGTIGDVACKRELIDVLVAFTAPMRQRRQHYIQDKATVVQVLKQGTERANQIANETISKVKKAMHQHYFD
jgi:tryptophanyl-tRNA synthetase